MLEGTEHARTVYIGKQTADAGENCSAGSKLRKSKRGPGAHQRFFWDLRAFSTHYSHDLTYTLASASNRPVLRRSPMKPTDCLKHHITR